MSESTGRVAGKVALITGGARNQGLSHGRLLASEGARVILATAPASVAVTAVVDGLGRNGALIVVGVDHEPIKVSPLQLIRGRHRLQGWASGTARDSEDTLRFSALTGVRPMIETFPLAEVETAYARMIENHARFRVVLTLG